MGNHSRTAGARGGPIFAGKRAVASADTGTTTYAATTAVTATTASAERKNLLPTAFRGVAHFDTGYRRHETD